jgi:nitrogen regulatory protein PII
MQLLVLILKKVECVDEIIRKLVDAGVKGGTILEGTGMAKSLCKMEELPIFGMLRRLMDDGVMESSKVMLFVLKDEQVLSTRSIIKEVVDLSKPNSGIMFSIPITYVEGLGDK